MFYISFYCLGIGKHLVKILNFFLENSWPPSSEVDGKIILHMMVVLEAVEMVILVEVVAVILGEIVNYILVEEEDRIMQKRVNKTYLTAKIIL